MEWTWISIAIIIGGALICCVGKYFLTNFIVNDKKPTGKSSNLVRIPFAFRITILVVAICCVVFALIALIIKGESWLTGLIVFLVAAFIWFLIFLSWQLWKIEITEDGIIYRNYIGKKKIYKFSELEYKPHVRGAKWYFYKDGKRILTVAYFIENAEALEDAYFKNEKTESSTTG